MPGRKTRRRARETSAAAPRERRPSESRDSQQETRRIGPRTAPTTTPHPHPPRSNLPALASAGLAALGWPLAIAPVAAESELHVAGDGPAWIAGAAMGGAALGFWLPRRMLVRRLGGPSDSRATPLMPPEFAASAVGILLAALGAVWLVLAIVTPGAESIRTALLEAFEWPAELVGPAVTLVLALSAALGGALSGVTLLVLHGWQRLVNPGPRPVRSLWITIAAGACAGSVALLAVDADVRQAIATIAAFAAAGVAVLTRGSAAPIAPFGERPTAAIPASGLSIVGAAAATTALALANARDELTTAIAAVVWLIGAAFVLQATVRASQCSRSVTAAVAGVGTVACAAAALMLAAHAALGTTGEGGSHGALVVVVGIAAVATAFVQRAAATAPRGCVAACGAACVLLAVQWVVSPRAGRAVETASAGARPCVAALLPELAVAPLDSLLDARSDLSLWSIDSAAASDLIIVADSSSIGEGASDRAVRRLVERGSRGAGGVERRLVLWPAEDERWRRAAATAAERAWVLSCGGAEDGSAIVLGSDVAHWVGHAANDPDLRSSLQRWRPAAARAP